jgi:aminoglycoside 6'-N-acetyltransferase
VLSGDSAQQLRPMLRGSVVTIRPGSPDEAGALRAILAEESVARWWDEPERADRTLAKLCELSDPVLLVIEIGGEVAGGIQYHEDQDPKYRQAGIDIYLATRFQGQGAGSEAISLLARYLFDQRGHHRITIDPAAANARAISCYRKAGFQPVGVMRQYERGRDGTFHDGLLMERLDTDPVPAQPAVDGLPARTFVVVSGPAGSGKTTLAQPLAPALGLPLIAKDTIKEAMMSVLPVPDVPASRDIGAASVTALLAVAAESSGAVLESVWYRSLASPRLAALPGTIVEVFCRCDEQVAARRRALRAGTRAAGHFAAERPAGELWNDEVARPVAGGWPVIEVSTNEPVDLGPLLARIRAAAGRQ